MASPNRMPINLSKFHQQSLLAWKLSFVHNFSPHKTFLWKNCNIIIRNKSLFFPKWFQRDINHILNLFDEFSNMLSYLTVYSFPIPFKEFNSLICAISNGLIQLVKSHSYYGENNITQPLLMLDGIELTNIKCNNKHIRQTFQRKNKTVPRGKFFWRSKIENINWRRAWLLPYKYCISNKAKEFHFKILHKIYPANCLIAKFTDIDHSCTFKHNIETISRLFFNCESSPKFCKYLVSLF